MPNVFRFRDSNRVLPHGSVEIQLARGWEYLDEPVEIVLDELDFALVEGRGVSTGERRVQGRDAAQLRRDIAAQQWTYVGKIEAQAVRQAGNAFYFEENDIDRGLPGSGSIRQPIPFKLIVPTGAGRDDRREFTFWITGGDEPNYEVAIKIRDASATQLAPSSDRFMLVCVRGRVVMPRYLEIVQPYYHSGWSPPTAQTRRLASSESDENLAQNCVDAIEGRLAGGAHIQRYLDGQSRYTSAEGRREEWVRLVVEHMTGLPYKYGHEAYGGRASGGDETSNWRDRVRSNGDYPCCNVCDQLGAMIQWIRGLPDPGRSHDYIRGGLRIHADNYRTWAGDATLARAGAVYYDSLAAARANTANWAKPGASIFFKKIEWQDGGWVTHTDERGTVIGHETTVMRTRETSRGLEVQLFDYGGNIQGNGTVRGEVGPLPPVAQESGWIRAVDALTLLDMAARPARPARTDGRGRVTREAIPARPASPPKFLSVGWRPAETSQPRRPGHPLGEATLTVYRNGAEVRTVSHEDLHGPGFRQTIYPVSHYLRAIGGLAHSDLIKAVIRIRSRPVFTNPTRSALDLLEISTDPDGLVQIESRV